MDKHTHTLTFKLLAKKLFIEFYEDLFIDRIASVTKQITTME